MNEKIRAEFEDAIKVLDYLFWLTHGSIKAGDHVRFRRAISTVAAHARYAGSGAGAGGFYCTNCDWENALRDHKGLCSELYMERCPAPAVPDLTNLRSGFLTGNSSGDGKYYLEIKFPDLSAMQGAHKELLAMLTQSTKEQQK